MTAAPPGSVVVAPESPDTADASALVAALESHLAGRYAAESRHGYSVATLIEQQVAFYVARVDGAPAGCGGVQLVGTEYAEIKRMWVDPTFRGLGLGRMILGRLAQHAREHGIGVLRLETGVEQTEAIALYESFGFRRIPPFGPYFDDPVSLCYEAPL
jgi:putative acetyltransferase